MIFLLHILYIHYVITGNKYKNQWRRNFNKGKYKEMRTYLANIDWNNLLKNKTATECWTCLKDEIEGITERLVPLRKQVKRYRKKHLSKGTGRNTCQKVQEETPVKRYRKKHLSKEAIRKIAHKP